MSKFIVVFALVWSFRSVAAESICFGTTSNGRLENGVKLPSSGDNYVSYSLSARLLGRTFVHSTVKKIVVDAYSRLFEEMPDKVFKYAETGFKDGGEFKPHKTHRNGLSVDFMTPVVDVNGKSVHLPTNVFNKLGYNIEFDRSGRFDGLRIDYDALAAHIVALHKEALANDVDLWRVIFDPDLQPNLFKTEHGKYLREHVQFSTKRSWVRHDEHYHVDFRVPCL
ncbi:penicillin-insensitive murein endopeptidase [Glaciecola siphonariae]|uniref:Penicillin-insensitive murein endopeptidase n=1 Tax=Glaciecola siphonariae TaxID=521012 RepID=A0ABV9LXF9_9ALTE